MPVTGNIQISTLGSGEKVYNIVDGVPVTASGADASGSSFYGTAADDRVAITGAHNAYVNLGNGADKAVVTDGSGVRVMTSGIGNSGPVLSLDGAPHALDSTRITNIAFTTGVADSATTVINGATANNFRLNLDPRSSASDVTFVDSTGSGARYTTATYTDPTGLRHTFIMNGIRSTDLPPERNLSFGTGSDITITNSADTVIVANGGIVRLDVDSTGTKITFGDSSDTTIIRGVTSDNVSIFVDDPRIKSTDALTFVDHAAVAANGTTPATKAYTEVSYQDSAGKTHSLQLIGVTSADVKDNFSFDSRQFQDVFYPDSTTGTSADTVAMDRTHDVNIYTLNGNDSVTLTRANNVVVNPGLGADTVSSTLGSGNTVFAEGGDAVTIGDRSDTVVIGSGSNTINLTADHSQTTFYIDPSKTGNTTVTGFKTGDVIQVNDPNLTNAQDLASHVTYATGADGKVAATFSYTGDDGKAHTLVLGGLPSGTKALQAGSFRTGEFNADYNHLGTAAGAVSLVGDGQVVDYRGVHNFTVHGGAGSQTASLTDSTNSSLSGGAGNDTLSVQRGTGNFVSGGKGDNAINVNGEKTTALVGEHDVVTIGAAAKNSIIGLSASSGDATITGFDASKGHTLRIDDPSIHSLADITAKGGSLTYNDANNTSTLAYTDDAGKAHTVTVNGDIHDGTSLSFGKVEMPGQQIDQQQTPDDDSSTSSHGIANIDKAATVGLAVLGAGFFSIGMAAFSFNSQKNKFRKEMDKAAQEFYKKNPNATDEQLAGFVDSLSERIDTFNSQGKNTFTVAGAITGFGAASAALNILGVAAMIGLTGPLGLAITMVASAVIAGIGGLIGNRIGKGISESAGARIVREAINSPENKKGPSAVSQLEEKRQKEETRKKILGK